MNDPVNPSSPDPHQGIGYETTDVNPQSIGLFAVGLVLMVALVLPLLSWLFWRFEATARKADPVQSPLARKQEPPAPRLQVEAAADLIRMQRQEDRQLANYGWIDQERRVVRLPISRAIEILAERGLPEPEGLPDSPPQQEPAR